MIAQLLSRGSNSSPDRKDGALPQRRLFIVLLQSRRRGSSISIFRAKKDVQVPKLVYWSKDL